MFSFPNKILEMFKGLYRGATSSFLGVAFESSLLFGIYSQIKQPLEGGLQSSKPQPSVIIPSAAISGGIISFVLCPSEPVKCRMQVLGTESLVPKSSRYNGPLDCALKTVKTEGYRNFSRWFYNLIKESIGNAVFFSTYESVHYYMHLQLKDASSNQNNLTDVGVGIMSGGLSGITVSRHETRPKVDGLCFSFCQPTFVPPEEVPDGNKFSGYFCGVPDFAPFKCGQDFCLYVHGVMCKYYTF
ncbi:unnamed protein product [Camellia sinensis]